MRRGSSLRRVLAVLEGEHDVVTRKVSVAIPVPVAPTRVARHSVLVLTDLEDENEVVGAEDAVQIRIAERRVEQCLHEIPEILEIEQRVAIQIVDRIPWLAAAHGGRQQVDVRVIQLVVAVEIARCAGTVDPVWSRLREERDRRRRVRQLALREPGGLRSVDDRIDRMQLSVAQADRFLVQVQAEIQMIGTILRVTVRNKRLEVAARNKSQRRDLMSLRTTIRRVTQIHATQGYRQRVGVVQFHEIRLRLASRQPLINPECCRIARQRGLIGLPEGGFRQRPLPPLTHSADRKVSNLHAERDGIDQLARR